ncbi:MAG: DNA (cytosine-5-)-methyltransferase [Acidimicrobiia bacterium]|nr:DNA (cytosine-5-)-methyltransferase [Acidimicrobiia bacterium]MYG59990.1 DNA (cytosine-5-)-methyltransferase [Acidimicrobiia bacterium]MYJ33682.1 DNA (cytosine-5-)-methyltransferase [Acidimicrobiia bacterium]
MSASQRKYGVPLVRGPVVEVPPHRNAVNSPAELLDWVPSRKTQRPLAADLFCGAGGLSIGLRDAGYDVALGVDNDPVALETYAGLHPGLALCQDLSAPEVIDELVELISAIGVELIAGGPPCQPFSQAGASKIRSLVQSGHRPVHDDRQDLWRSFIKIVQRVQPRAVLFENVPDMAIASDTTIFRTLVSELEAAGYAVHTALLRSCEYRVPQLRQRLFLVALAEGTRFTWPAPSQTQITVWDAISDLPPVKGGWRSPNGADGYLDYVPTRTPTAFAKRARRGLSELNSGRVHDHITRPVRDDDRAIFESMDSTTRYSQIDESLKRYRDDIFDDKYKRLDWEKPSRSITAHIARDGYWYIHPDQTRTLTVREAARLQTFPDRVRFAGPPSTAFRQIGNAVPPRLAERVARSVRRALENAEPGGATTAAISERLASWFEHKGSLVLPWINASTTWAAIQGYLLLDRAPRDSIATAWPTLDKLDSPQRTIESADQLLDLGKLIQRETRVQRVLDAAHWCAQNPEATSDAIGIKRSPHMGPRAAQMAALAEPSVGPTPVVVNQGTLRVASRVLGIPHPKRRLGSEGRLAITRLLGGPTDARPDTSRAAMAAVLELAATLCKRENPQCSECPLHAECAWSKGLALNPAGR